MSMYNIRYIKFFLKKKTTELQIISGCYTSICMFTKYPSLSLLTSIFQVYLG